MIVVTVVSWRQAAAASMQDVGCVQKPGRTRINMVGIVLESILKEKI